MLDLSIIIVNYNTKQLVLDCIKSIKISKPKVSYEIILIDNGSKDGSVEELDKIKGVKTIFNKSNLGFSRAANQGIGISKGKHSMLLNTDAIVKRGAIDFLYRFGESTSDAGVVGSKLLNPDGTTQNSAFYPPTVIRAIKQFWFGKKGYYGQYYPKTKKPVAVYAVVGAAFLITHRAKKKVGVLDERYFMFFEDIDYCDRVRKCGLKVYYLPTSKVIHYLGKSGEDLADELNQWRRLIQPSKIYHGLLKYYLIYFVMWTGQKIGKKQ